MLHGPYVGVGCIVLRGGNLLLVRDRRGNQPGTWSTPGGHLDPGETPAACAARETFEETGVRIANVEFVAVTNDIFESSGRHYVTIWMRGEPDDSEAMVLDSEEIAEVGWFPPPDLPQPLFLSLVNLLAGRSLPVMRDPLAALR